jgi:glycerol-3-phosphate O-acyltransferase
VPSFSAFAYFGFGIRVARWLANVALHRAHWARERRDARRAFPPDATVVFVMNHRSNMDYVLVTYLAAARLGAVLCGGRMGADLAAVATDQVDGGLFHPPQVARQRALPRFWRAMSRWRQPAGVTQAIFPEGGLSLDGRLAPPKMGCCPMWSRPGGASRDVVFVPVAHQL